MLHVLLRYLKNEKETHKDTERTPNTVSYLILGYFSIILGVGAVLSNITGERHWL